jgi:tRNA threonylcarbamoyladenosine biosynthesis protein TsaE
MDTDRALADVLPATTAGPEETREIGRRIAGALGQESIIALEGPLGAGKTELVKGIADGVGLDGDAVSSPTFTVVHEYRGSGTILYHVDAYRVESEAELSELGIEDVLYGEGWCVIEWPERLGRLLPPRAVRIRLEHRGANHRHISLPAVPS